MSYPSAWEWTPLAVVHHPSECDQSPLATVCCPSACEQLPLAILEGIITVIVIIGLETYAKQEMKEIGFLRGEN